MDEVLDKVVGHEFIYFLDGFFDDHEIQIVRLLQNNVYYGLGNICLGVDAIWVQDYTSYKP
jgi:hypothetical protein